MHALLHTLCAVVVVPYVALSLLFIFVGQLAASKGMLPLLRTVWSNFFFYFTKGMFVAPVLWACLVAMGFVPALQRTGSVCVGLLALASVIVIVGLTSSRWEPGALLFLAPCLLVVVTSSWLALRAGVDG